MDEEHHLNYIKQVIDKTFAENPPQQTRKESLEGEYFFCGGYLLACVSFHIISPEMHTEFQEYCGKIYKQHLIELK